LNNSGFISNEVKFGQEDSRQYDDPRHFSFSGKRNEEQHVGSFTHA